MRKSNRVVLALILGLLVISGCATAPQKTEGGAVGQVIKDATDVAAVPGAPKAGTLSANSTAPQITTIPLEVWGQKLKVYKFDYPVIVNPAVEHWISYFQGKGRRYFEKYLERGQY